MGNVTGRKAFNNIRDHISGCSMGFDVGLAHKIGVIPSLIFCWYCMFSSKKDPSFSYEILRKYFYFLTTNEIDDALEVLKKDYDFDIFCHEDLI